MSRLVLGVLALALTSVAGAALAQAQAWVQIEARPDLPTAEARAGAFAARLPDVAGFTLSSGWFAIALGPYSADQAQAELAQLLAQGAIPSDSYVSDGHEYGSRFWPAGAAAQAQPQPAAPTATAPVTAPAATPAVAQAQPGQPAAAPQETPAEARAAEAQLPLADRMELQRALAWEGAYSGAIDGAIGPGTRAAMAAWQQAKGEDQTGVLTTAQRQALLAAYHREQSALGISPVEDANAGIAVELPLALVRFKDYAPPFAHYQAKDASGVNLSLLSAPGGQAALGTLYALIQKLAIMPAEGPRSLTDRGFEISGQGADLHAFAHAELSGDAVKGYLVTWKPADDARMAHVLEALKASFRSTGPQVLDGSIVTLSAAERQGMLAGLDLRKPALSRSGFFVDAGGDVLTTTGVLQSCAEVTFGDNRKAQVLFQDAALGIALLRPDAPLAPRAFAHLAATPPSPGSRIAVAGYSYGGQLLSAALTFGGYEAPESLDGRTELSRLSLTAQPGDAGGPVLDASGGLVGLLRPPPSDANTVLPKTVNYATDAAPIATALAAHDVTLAPAPATPPLAAEDLAALGRKMTVLVSCWK